MLKREDFNKIYQLINIQPWLINKNEQLLDLISTDCRSAEQQYLIVDLLSRFQYLTQKKFIEIIKEIIIDIVTDPVLSEENTIIVATTVDSSADSSQYFVYQMKPIFQEQGWSCANLVNNINKAIRKSDGKKDIYNIIIVDEFIGSGSTMLGRINLVKEQLSRSKIENYLIRIYSAAGSNVGIELLKSKEVDVRCTVHLPRGITDHFEENVPRMLAEMIKMEDLLSKDYKGRKLPSLGYGNTEALYARENGNLPNNVFPVFWWAQYADGTVRRTVLTRFMGDA